MSNGSDGIREEHMTLYAIRVMGHLDPQWSEWFDGLAVTHPRSGITVLTGDIVDQAALHGTLNKIRDLNLPLMSLTGADPDPVDPGPTGPLPHSQRPNGV
jgi:hypothetical protein